MVVNVFESVVADILFNAGQPYFVIVVIVVIFVGWSSVNR
jgi:hypothetical protein